LDTWRFCDWAIKVYGISTEAADQKLVIDQGLVKEAHSFVEANLARMEETSHYSVGFVILHHGSAAKSLLTHWWTNECVCLQYVAQSEFAGPPKLIYWQLLAARGVEDLRQLSGYQPCVLVLWGEVRS
jgi:hypothetical protein